MTRLTRGDRIRLLRQRIEAHERAAREFAERHPGVSYDDGADGLREELAELEAGEQDEKADRP